MHIHPHHITTIRSSVTRNISRKFDEISDEALAALNDYVPHSQGQGTSCFHLSPWVSLRDLTTEDWVSVPAYRTLLHIVCRTTNRYLVGLPLCKRSFITVFVRKIMTQNVGRNPEYLFISEQFTIDVVTSAMKINSFPDFLKP